MIVSAHQPGYLPWIGYFNKINLSDVFVFMDTVQLTNSSSMNYVTRNMIKTSNGPLLLSLPIKRDGFMKKSIKDIEIDYEQNWVSKHLKSIEVNYKKSLNFDKIFPELLILYEKKIELFSDFCFEQLFTFKKILNIQTKVIKLSEMSIVEKKSDLILEICNKLKAKKYIAGGNTMNYLSEENFVSAKIEIIHQKFQHPIYNQLYGPFIENMSIIDYIMNVKEINI